MLVIPALLSLKPSIIESNTNPEMMNLLKTILRRLRDQSEIVAKTAKKLILELNKCFSQAFIRFYVDQFSIDEERLVCMAILQSDDQETQRLIQLLAQRQSQSSQAPKIITNNSGGSKEVEQHNKNSLLSSQNNQ